MKKAGLAIGAVVLAIAGGMKLESARADLEGQQRAIGQAWTRVDAALQRRAETLPDLMRTAGGIAPAAKAVYTEIEAARKALLGAGSPEERIRKNSQLDGVIGRLLIALETQGGDPAAREHTRIHDELAGAENRIAVERRKYNEAVQKYNTSIELFPGNLAARIFGFTRSDAYFKTEPTGQLTPAAKK